MLFLIEYSPKESVMITFKRFDDTEESIAKKERLALEIDLNRKKVSHEVSLFRASSEAEFRHTHARYFESLATLQQRMKATLKAA
jgi:hypothetical protein